MILPGINIKRYPVRQTWISQLSTVHLRANLLPKIRQIGKYLLVFRTGKTLMGTPFLYICVSKPMGVDYKM